MLSEKQVKANGKTYFEQAFKILDKKKTEVHYNSKWLKKLGALELARISNLFGLHEFASREVIARRLKADKRVSYLELMYPIMQGYDSVAVKADVELGGTDQRFNLLTGRDIQRFYKQEPQDILTVSLMEGTDGRKMSSSWGNVVNITDEPNNMFGKVMSIPDNLIEKYFLLATRTPTEEIKRVVTDLQNPRDQKLILAQSITSLYHGDKKAAEAKNAFVNQFSKGELPAEIEIKKLKPGTYLLSQLLVDAGLVSSKSESRRLISQNGVKVDQKPAKDVEIVIDSSKEYLLQVGKRKFLKIK
jgi:tyrosyl-tRNA synthetase